MFDRELKKMELHFYPGQHLLALKQGTETIGRYEAWGGTASIGNEHRMTSSHGCIHL